MKKRQQLEIWQKTLHLTQGFIVPIHKYTEITTKECHVGKIIGVPAEF